MTIKRLYHLIRSRLLYKMLIIYSILTLVPLLVVSTAFYMRSSNLIEKNVTEQAQQQLSATADWADEQLYAISKRLIVLSQQGLITSLLRMDNLFGNELTRSPEHAATERAVLDLLQSEVVEARQQIGAFVGDVYIMNTSGRLYGTESSMGIQYKDAFKILPFQYDRSPQWAFFIDHGRIACEMKIFVKDSDQVMGYLIMTVDPVTVKQWFASYPENHFFITNLENLIVVASDSGTLGNVLDARGSTDQLVIKQKSRYADFIYVNFVQPGTNGVVAQQLLFATVITLIAWLLVSIVTYFILKRITIPIRKLVRLMRKAESEEYHLIGPIPSNDEIAVLCQGYDQLIIRTENLIDTNYKNELLKREAELKAIRMYINPHFLYNTLEFISIMSTSSEKAKYIPDIVQKLANIFRFSIVPGETFIPLEQEIEFSVIYLQIHKYRLGERLTFNIVIEPHLSKVVVPKLILQPLVENAIIHGISLLPEGGHLEIHAFEEKYNLVIEIENNSPVPTEPALETFKDKKGLGSGLDNVNARIHYHFGNKYGAIIRYKENQALLRLTMPIQL